MATQASRNLSLQDKHTVGNLVSSRKYIKDYPNGALYTEDVDNFHLVELSYNATLGEPEVKYLTDVTKKADEVFLSCGVEIRFLEWEPIDAFFNGKGEKQRIVYLTQGLMFDTSAFEKDTTITGEIQTGNFAHYDTTKKKFVIHDGSVPAYATAGVKFVVRRTEADTMFTLGQPMVRLVVL